jgi:integrase
MANMFAQFFRQAASGETFNYSHSTDGTVEKLVSIYMADVNRRPNMRSNANVRAVLSRFVEDCGGLRVAFAKPFHLRRFLDQQPTHKSQWTRKRWCATVQACFNWLAKMGYIERNPFHGITERGGKRGRPIEPSEFRALLRHATDTHFRQFILFLYLSGCRPCEAASARWSDLKIESQKVVLEKTKRIDLVKSGRFISTRR